MPMIDLRQGDCLELLKGVPDKSVDLVVTDPPYLMDVGRCGGVFRKYIQSYQAQLIPMADNFNLAVLDELVRVMKKVNIYIWCSKDQLRQYINYFEERGCKTDLLCWHKTNPIPTCNNKYLSDTEYLLFFREHGVRVYGHHATKRKWYVTPQNSSDKKRYGHPTIKPLHIIENLILNSSQEGDVVLDPFIGSGTTAEAAVNTNRHCIGFDIDENCIETAEKRVSDAIKKK